MKKIISFFISVSILLSPAVYVFAQEDKPESGVFVIRKAQELQETIVGVEAYLNNDILEVSVSARMHGAKPKIFNAVIMGPKLGRLSPDVRKMIFATGEEEEPFFTEELEGKFLRTSKKKESKKAAGTLTKEAMKFKIPKEKILPGKKYKLWIKVESMQNIKPIQTFKFELDNLAELIHGNTP